MATSSTPEAREAKLPNEIIRRPKLGSLRDTPITQLSSTSPQSTSQPATLLDLPGEIRCIIWKCCQFEPLGVDFCGCCGVRAHVVVTCSLARLPKLDRLMLYPSLLLVNRQVHHEAKEIISPMIDLSCSSAGCSGGQLHMLSHRQRGFVAQVTIFKQIPRLPPLPHTINLCHYGFETYLHVFFSSVKNIRRLSPGIASAIIFQAEVAGPKTTVGTKKN